MTTPTATRTVWRGLACTQIDLPGGDRVRVADFGAHVLSWTAQGHERLFLSERAVMDGSGPIRGGVPVCFPQFNVRGPLPKHGLARCATWQWLGAEAANGADSADMDASAFTARWQWDAAAPLHPDFPHALRAQVAVTVAPGVLRIALSATNTGSTPFAFTGALHTYLAVQGADVGTLDGLDGAAFWDAARAFAPAVQAGAVALGPEVDRVYARPASALHWRDAAGTLAISQDTSWSEVVVWNPGPTLCATLADMQPTDWTRMLCVEAATLNRPLALHPGQHWQGAQTLRVVG